MFTGRSCNALIATQNYQPSHLPFTCELALSSTNQNLAVSDLFTVNPVFLSKIGKCYSPSI